MPRAKTPDGRRVGISAKFSEPEAERIDAARGTTERGTWLREAALAVLETRGESRGAEPGRAVMAGPDPAEQQRVIDDFRHREPDGAPRRRKAAATGKPPEPPLSASLPSVPPPGFGVVVVSADGEIESAKDPVTVKPAAVVRRASQIEAPPRCSHSGVRQIGGWCVKCQADVKPGGRLPDGWVKPEGWPS